MVLDMSSDSLVLANLPYRHSRVGSLQHVVLFAGCLASLAVVLLLAGAILSVVVFTEVQPPTADENYHRYVGADFRRVIGPVMMAMAGFMLALGCVCTLMGYTSAKKDLRELYRDDDDDGVGAGRHKAAELDTFQEH